MEVSKSCASANLLCLLFVFLFLDAPMAATKPSPPQLNKTHKRIMRDISSLVSSGNSTMALSLTKSWNTSSNPCLWSGVICSSSHGLNSSASAVVTRLSLSGFGLSNTTIRASICPLDTLQSLDLSKNYFADLQGQFSPCPMKAGLRALNLSSNKLAGQLSEFSSFPKLEVLDLSSIL